MSILLAAPTRSASPTRWPISSTWSAPSDRPAAEEELREAGIDPVHVARRAEQIAARIAPAEATRPAAARCRRPAESADAPRVDASAARRPIAAPRTSAPRHRLSGAACCARRPRWSSASLSVAVLARDAFLPGSVPAERIGAPRPEDAEIRTAARPAAAIAIGTRAQRRRRRQRSRARADLSPDAAR